MDYLKKTFTVAPGKEKAYRDNYESVFGKPFKLRVRKELQGAKKPAKRSKP